MKNFREQFPIVKKYTYLNHAAISAPSIKVNNAVKKINDNFCNCAIDCYYQWMEQIEHVRKLYAGLINAHAEEIAFVGNTSEGLSSIAQSLTWKENDVVLLPVSEFPANIYPWLNLEKKGVKVKYIQQRDNGRFDIEDVEKALTPKVKLLAVSSVNFLSGFYCNLQAFGEFCRKKGILFCVDAIQSIGVIPMDVKKFGIHFLAAGAYKWMLGCMGTGAIYVSSEIREAVCPAIVGWKSVVNDDDFFEINFNIKPNALGFEPGAMNISGIYALGAAIELINEAGVENIKKKVFSINDLFIKGLSKRGIKIITPLGKDERSGILSFQAPGNREKLYEFLSSRNIMVSLRKNLIRLSPHFYNDKSDVSSFFKCIDDFYA